MSYSFSVAAQQVKADVTATCFVARALVTVVTGTYPAGGIGPLGLQNLYNIASTSAPIKTNAGSEGNPPSGIVYQYDPTTDKLRAMVTGTAAGAALEEFSGSIPADTIAVEQFFNRY
jgi:hypothetical protein